MPLRYLHRKFTRRILQINDTPESIAMGTAIGVFIAMTPTVGVQMILILIINTLVRANRIAGLVMVYLSNPFTMIPLYWLDYQVGTRVLGLAPVTHDRFESIFDSFLEDIRANEWWGAFKDFATVNFEIFMPMLTGGVLLGVLLATPVYPITLRLVRGHQRRRSHKQALLKLREIRREERSRAAAAARSGVEPASEPSLRAEPTGSAAKPEPGVTPRSAGGPRRESAEGSSSEADGPEEA